MANSDWPSVDPSLWLGATLPRPFEEIIGWGEREAWDSPKKPCIFRSLVKLPLYNPQKKRKFNQRSSNPVFPYLDKNSIGTMIH